MNKLAPEVIIKNYNVETKEQLEEAINNYKDENFVVKPEGLTGGKGVKVGGIHFYSKEEGYEYATFDYPYRFAEDKGPGTGGMGCMSYKDGLLPFLTKEDVDKCAELMKKTINYLNKDSKEFTGVLYGGFFKTKEGIKFIEFNARFGDPEAINVLNALETPFTEVLEHIINGTLSSDNCKFTDNYTFTVYIVSKDYAVKPNKEPTIFKLDAKKIKEEGLKLYFANAKKIEENTYTSVSNSRLFAIEATGEDFETIRQKVYKAIEENVDTILDYRKDIGEIYVH